MSCYSSARFFLNIFDFAQLFLSNMAELKSIREIKIAFIKKTLKA